MLPLEQSTADEFSVIQWRFDVIIVLFLKNLPIRDNLRKRDNALCTKVSLIKRFHCISTCSKVKYYTQRAWKRRLFLYKVLCVDYDHSEEATSKIMASNVTFSINFFLDRDNFISYLSVYCICMSVALFFFIMMFCMVFVYSSKDP